ncbi:MAG: pyridoxamine 5'-phosphate oxidase [Dehalococcoidia bacterium]|nr:pyridoxamine 5'-phosphate oxidase [Dehalococcoidia bacterium]
MNPHADPFSHFAEWFEAARAEEPQPEAVNLATADADGRPANRMVLVRRWSSEGFEVYTDTGSRKGADLAANPRAALCWHWKGLGRQVRAEGLVTRLPGAQADTYWAGRPRGSRLSAITSHQSQPVESHEVLAERLRAVDAEHEGREVPRPERWGGYLVTPLRVEFWQEGESRLHDRLEYARASVADRWATRTLQP